MSKLLTLTNQLETKIPFANTQKKIVSKANVAWHLGHIFLVINGITQQLATSDIYNFKKSFNLSRFIVFSLNKIPKGKGKSPDRVKPKTDISENEIIELIKVAKLKIEELNTLNPQCNFEHPYFGQLNVKQAIKFLEIHTKHHLKIIEDIIK